ncbi:MAG: hypothetical protein IJ714_01350 [Bacteroidales bacterium]|nr:hypothetical protein [Bacteroidales bacterium]
MSQIAYKGFNRDLTCRDFQYEEGKEFEIDGDVKLCSRGFHACEDPIDCFDYYDPANSVFHEVELEGVSPERRGDSKVVAKKIRIGARLKLHEMIKAAIDFRFAKTTVEPGAHTDKDRCSVSATGYKGAASATGYKGAASATGYKGAASATGYNGAASATGDNGAASATGDNGAASATGDNGAASATGDNGAASATGYKGAASATGYKGAASATGYKGAASATGDNGAALTIGDLGCASVASKLAIAVAIGHQAAAAGCLDSWIVLAERDEVWNEDKCQYDYPIKEVKAFHVDGETIKADTFYRLENGQPVEVDDPRNE